MSHVVTVDVEFRDLTSLKDACRDLGWTFNEGKRTCKWYGTWVDDTRVPDGIFSPEETERLRNGSKAERTAAMEKVMGTCDHEIVVPGAAYTMGVYQKPNGAYGVRWDFWGQGGLTERVGGVKADKLRQSYGVAHTRRVAKAGGYAVHENRQQDGTVRLVLRRH